MVETTIVSLSNEELEGSMNSIYSTLNGYTNKKWKDLLVFMCSESSIMLYSNVFLIVSQSNNQLSHTIY
jgi:hypothetical protein